MLKGSGFHARTTRLWKQWKATSEMDLGYLKDMPEARGNRGTKESRIKDHNLMNWSFKISSNYDWDQDKEQEKRMK